MNIRICVAFAILCITFVVVDWQTVNAGYNCVDDPKSTSIPPTKRCIEDPVSPYSLRECLQGGIVYVEASACKNDPRYQLRNFAPMLNFPTIGSMLNLATGVVGSVAGILCGISMFYGTYRYLSAAGEEKKLESARSRMIYSVIGLVIVILAYSIVKIILDVTSTNTVGF